MKKYYWQRTEYPAIVVAETQDDDIYYLVNNEDELLLAFKAIFDLRNSFGYYSYELNIDEEDWARKIHSGEAEFRIYYDFLMRRSNKGYEYEGIKIRNPVKLE